MNFLDADDDTGRVREAYGDRNYRRLVDVKAKYDLNFTLGSDEDGKVCEAYGTWIEKSMYGRKYMGVERSTFLVDGKGVLRREWRKVKVPGHADEVLAASAEL